MVIREISERKKKFLEGDIPNKNPNKRTFKTKAVLLNVPAEILEKIEEDLNKTPLKTSRSRWMIEAFLEKLNQK